MTATMIGPATIEVSRDEEGHRDYDITYKVECDTPAAPEQALNASGLPAIGSVWSTDTWALCSPVTRVTALSQKEGDPVYYWLVTRRFTTRPQKRCQDAEIGDPLSEPQKISGTFATYQKEGTFDKDGELIKTSSHEQIRGSQNEWDFSAPTVRIEQNVSSLDLPTVARLQSPKHVNDALLWGVPARCVKFSNFSWERLYYGSCYAYCKRVLDFEINYDTFDRYIPDEGSKVLHGHWGTSGWILDNIDGSAPDPDNPSHFDRFKDRNGENARVLLDGAGKPAIYGRSIGTGSGTGQDYDPGTIFVQFYPEANLLTLGIPTSLV